MVFVCAPGQVHFSTGQVDFLVTYPTGQVRKSPGSRLYANVQSRLHNPAPRITRPGGQAPPNLSAERRAGIKPQP